MKKVLLILILFVASYAAADTLTLNEYCELPFPAVHLSAEQAAYITPLQGRIGLETDLQASRWILGEDALDDDAVSAFRGRLEAEGLDSFMQFWQERLDETEVQP